MKTNFTLEQLIDRVKNGVKTPVGYSSNCVKPFDEVSRDKAIKLVESGTEADVGLDDGS